DLTKAIQGLKAENTIGNKGSFPAQPLPNPKSQYEVSDPSSSNQMEQAKSITTLMSRKTIDKTIPFRAEKPKDPEMGKEDGSSHAPPEIELEPRG
ncbi:hypothetical protein PJP10_31650, partial [Mycobacterium kansasii]